MADTTTSHIKSQWWLLGSTDRWPQPQQCYLGTPGLDLVTRVMSVWWVGFQRDATSPSESWLTEEFIWPFRADLKKDSIFPQSLVVGGWHQNLHLQILHCLCLPTDGCKTNLKNFFFFKLKYSEELIRSKYEFRVQRFSEFEFWVVFFWNKALKGPCWILNTA